ncbi:hypothetical protein L226DRAFT_524956 [Lentinus tigrinus ALCF2SS1-7]|uniref:Uncharacterized protein n=1 Tax=Lentinus tigrinus ALCF2SS1-6 TaxID=1328759 RepID=A0A5C2S211_9APHY|nr:hypothetical protein L227DRAFT_587606 [Lentinus tigrinus ALCF2SS1-6]RPD72104.1 hypothetical protein L226DRAFT_524956 [Lentinus tigrinus ALCF2SS1-7]
MSAAAATRTGLKGLRFHIGPRTLRSQGVNVENVQPIYNCKSLPWWSKWTYFLVAADLVVTAGACELTWNHWTTLEEPQKSTDDTVTTGDGPEAAQKYVPRPWWQRGFFVATNLAAGIGIAGVLLGARSRMVRRMYIIPNPASQSGGRLLVIQSPLHPRNHGAVYPLHRTRLVNSPDPSETMIGLKDNRGHYSVMLKGAEVGGEKMASVWDARKALFTTWYGEEKGSQLLMASAKVKED